MTRLLSIFTLLVLTASCSYLPSMDNILPDKSQEYKKSESLPDLEVPPDLTAEAINDSMSIPNEGASLSQYQQRRNNRNGDTPVSAPEPDSEEQWVSVRGNNGNIWPRLRTFMGEQGYSMDLDDAELGVLETNWAEPFVEEGFSYRDKFKIFSEPGAEPGVTVLYVSNQRQVLAKRQDGSDSWSDKDKSIDAEKKLAGDLNLYFNGSRNAIVSSSPGQSSAAAASAAPRKKAVVESTNDGKEYLAIPQEFTRAWRHTEIALERAGLPIESKDSAAGIYRITYFDAQAGEEKGWLSKLKFWGGDDAPEGMPFQISLTGVGDKTELVILDGNGEWATDNNALQIMAIIQNHLNSN